MHCDEETTAPSRDWLSGAPAEVAAPPVTFAPNAVHHGRLDIKLQALDNRWLHLLAADGTDRGALMNNEHGPVLVGSSGDFAEYHKKIDGECDFSEGEVVSIGPDGLSRNTKGALQLGVISRRMIVAGSRPAVSQLCKYDTVAYSGRVPVRLRGSFSSGDCVVPSGLFDGTAVAKPGNPSVRIGRIVCQAPVDEPAVKTGSCCVLLQWCKRLCKRR